MPAWLTGFTRPLLRQFALLVVLLVDPGVNQQRHGQNAATTPSEMAIGIW
jgi:hypothetical protein